MLYYLLYFIFVGVIPFAVYCWLCEFGGSDSGTSSKEKKYSKGVPSESMPTMMRETRGKSAAERRRIIKRYCR